MHGSSGVSFTSGFDGSLGISVPLSDNGLFFGAELGCMSYNANMEWENNIAVGICFDIAPSVGIKIPFSEKIHLAPYVGPYIGYVISGDDVHGNWDKHNAYLAIKDGIDAGINVGFELFLIKSFFIDVHFKKGFCKIGKFEDTYYDVVENLSGQKIALGIGFQF